MIKAWRQDMIVGSRWHRFLFVVLAGSVLAAAVGCQKQVEPPPPDPAREFTGLVGRAHGAAAWQNKAVVQADFAVDFNGKRIIDGRYAFLPSLGLIRAEMKDGTILVYDGQDAWVLPPAGFDTREAMPMARFHLMTWPYFLAAPMKLDDDGTQVELSGSQPVDESMVYMPTAKLTFKPGTGDAPDDWYILYRNPANNRLAAMAYIVTYGVARNDAAKNPHAVIYKNYVTVDGVTLPTQWTFYNWDKQRGAYGKPIGHVRVSNIRFVSTPQETFVAPPGSVVDVVPGK